jgi:hypothetical protein
LAVLLALGQAPGTLTGPLADPFAGQLVGWPVVDWPSNWSTRWLARRMGKPLGRVWTTKASSGEEIPAGGFALAFSGGDRNGLSKRPDETTCQGAAEERNEWTRNRNAPSDVKSESLKDNGNESPSL